MRYCDRNCLRLKVCIGVHGTSGGGRGGGGGGGGGERGIRPRRHFPGVGILRGDNMEF